MPRTTIRTRDWYQSLDVYGLLEALGAQLIRRSGRQLRARCPYPDHEDREPSFFIDIRKPGLPFHCFGCSRGGNAITLVQDLGFSLELLNRHGATLDLSGKKRVASRNNVRKAGRRRRFWNSYEQTTQVLKLLDRAPVARVKVRRFIELNWDVKKRQANNILSRMVKRGMLIEDNGVLYSTQHIIRNGGQFFDTTGEAILSIEQLPALRFCEACNRPLAGRRDKKYCSKACKQQVYRTRNARKRKAFKYNPNFDMRENLARAAPSIFGKEVMQARRRLEVVSRRSAEISEELKARRHMIELWKLHDHESVDAFIGDAAGEPYRLKAAIVLSALDGAKVEDLKREYAELERERERLLEVVYP